MYPTERTRSFSSQYATRPCLEATPVSKTAALTSSTNCGFLEGCNGIFRTFPRRLLTIQRHAFVRRILPQGSFMAHERSHLSPLERTLGQPA